MTGILRHAILPLLLALPLRVSADVVQSRSARLEGEVRLRADRIEVAGQTVRWDDLLFLVRRTDQRPLFDRGVVWLRSGEAWAADALARSGRKLKLRLPLCGEREVELARLASVDFVPNLPPARDERDGTLYRDAGEPIPGKLLWLDLKQIAIDSPLGILEIPRDTARRYVVERRPAPSPAEGEDELFLADGSLLRGQLTPGSDALALEHALLGKLTIPAHAVRAIVRHPPGVLYLAEAQAEETTAVPLVLFPEPPKRLGVPRGSDQASADTWVKGLRVEPKTRLRYRLPEGAGRKLVLRSGLQPLPGAKGAVRLRVVSAAKALFDQELVPGADWPALSLALPDADHLAIEVDFGQRIHFPCGVVLCDPHVVAR